MEEGYPNSRWARTQKCGGYCCSFSPCWPVFSPQNEPFRTGTPFHKGHITGPCYCTRENTVGPSPFELVWSFSPCTGFCPRSIKVTLLVHVLLHRILQDPVHLNWFELFSSFPPSTTSHFGRGSRSIKVKLLVHVRRNTIGSSSFDLVWSSSLLSPLKVF